MAIITNIPDAISAIVEQMNYDGYDLKFQFGHPKEIQQILMEQTKDKVLKHDKYPLLILFLDFEEAKNQSDKNYFTEASVNMVIVTSTDKNYKASERLENVFKPILWPLYEAFVNYLQMINIFDTDTKGRIAHDKTDRYFYAQDEAKAQNVFAAYLDAVEITNLELKMFDPTCHNILLPELFNVVHNGDNVIYNGENVIYKTYS